MFEVMTFLAGAVVVLMCVLVLIMFFEDRYKIQGHHTFFPSQMVDIT